MNDLTQIEEIMKEQLKWIKLAGLDNLRKIFENELRTKEDKLVYELSDGENSSRYLEELTSVSKSKVSILWRRWYKMGIMEKSKKYERKRMKKLFSLDDVGMGIDLPDTIKSTKLNGDLNE